VKIPQFFCEHFPQLGKQPLKVPRRHVLPDGRYLTSMVRPAVMSPVTRVVSPRQARAAPETADKAANCEPQPYRRPLDSKQDSAISIRTADLALQA